MQGQLFAQDFHARGILETDPGRCAACPSKSQGFGTYALDSGLRRNNNLASFLRHQFYNPRLILITNQAS